MTVRKSQSKPKRPTAPATIRRLRSAFGSDGVLVLCPEAQEAMSRELITLDDLLSAICHESAKPVIGSYRFEAGLGCWHCYVIGVLPDCGIRLEILLKSEESNSEVIQLISIRCPY